MIKRFTAAICICVLLLCLCLSGCSREDVSLGRVVIFGDSYSTFDGHIPEGYPTWYAEDADYTDVRAVKDTWWDKLMRKTDSELVLNSSYSGSTVCHTGYNGDDYSAFSFVARAEKLAAEGFFEAEEIDTVIIYGGLNDFWAGSPLGEIKYDGITEWDSYYFFPAVAKMLATLREASADMRIIYIIEYQLSYEMNTGIKKICAQYGVEVIEPPQLSVASGHPDRKGMKTLSDSIVSYLKSDNR